MDKRELDRHLSQSDEEAHPEWTADDIPEKDRQRLQNEVTERFYRSIVKLQVLFDKRLTRTREQVDGSVREHEDG